MESAARSARWNYGLEGGPPKRPVRPGQAWYSGAAAARRPARGGRAVPHREVACRGEKTELHDIQAIALRVSEWVGKCVGARACPLMSGTSPLLSTAHSTKPAPQGSVKGVRGADLSSTPRSSAARAHPSPMHPTT